MFSPQRSRIHTHIHTCQVTSVMSYSLWPRDCSPPGSSVQGDTPGKNTRVGSHALLHGIFPTEGSNLHLLWLLHFRGILTTDPAGKPAPPTHTHQKFHQNAIIINILNVEKYGYIIALATVQENFHLKENSYYNSTE